MRPSPNPFSPVPPRALLFLLVALAATAGLAQSDKFNLPVDRAAPGRADQAEGARILGEFRRAGIAGDYWLSFELRVMPRQGAERIVTGTLLGKRGVAGPFSRLTVAGEELLIASGPQPSAWMARSGGEIMPAPMDHPVAGTGLTIFDLQMPFLYWTDFTYEGQAKVRGRPTHSFILRPPSGDVRPVAEFTGVRVLIDTQFQALVQAELLAAKGAVVKSIVLLDLKKVGDQWLVKSIDVRDHGRKEKTRLTITQAALSLTLPDETFSTGQLRAAPPAIPPEKVVRF